MLPARITTVLAMRWTEEKEFPLAHDGALRRHHQAVMAHADWIIDLGPGAGHDGGRIVFEGTPADLVAAKSTLTGQHLAAYVGG